MAYTFAAIATIRIELSSIHHAPITEAARNEKFA